MEVSCEIFLFELFISLNYSKSQKLLPCSSLPIFWLEIDLYALLLICCVLSSLYYIWLICIHPYSFRALLCTLVSL